jgi:hypothetical protein
MIRCIRKSLGFHGEPGAARIHDAALAGESAVETIAGLELQARRR